MPPGGIPEQIKELQDRVAQLEAIVAKCQTVPPHKHCYYVCNLLIEHENKIKETEKTENDI